MTEQDLFENNIEEGVDLFTTPSIKPSVSEGLANSSAAQGSFVIGGDLAEDYSSIKNSLLFTGVSEELENIKVVARGEEESLDIDAATDVLLDDSVSTKKKGEFITEVNKLTETREGEGLHLTYAKSLVETVSDQTDPEYSKLLEQKALVLSENPKDILEVELERIKLRAVSLDKMPSDIVFSYTEQTSYLMGKPNTTVTDSISGTTIELGQNIINIGIPRVLANKYNALVEHMLPKVDLTPDEAILAGTFSIREYLFSDDMWVGNQVDKLQDHFAKLKTNEEKLAWANKMVGFLKNYEGWFQDQASWENMIVLDTLLDTAHDPDAVNVNQIIENIVVPLDFMLIGGLVRSGLNGIRSVLGIASGYNPKLAREIAAAGMMNDDAARSLGTTKEQIAYDSHFPPIPSINERMSASPVEVIQQAISNVAASILARGYTSPPNATRVLKERLWKKVGLLHVNKSEITVLDKTNGIYETSALVGQDAAVGFPTIAEAAEAAKKVMDLKKGQPLGMFKRDDSGAIVRITKDDLGAEEAGEYFYQYKAVEKVQVTPPIVSFFNTNRIPILGDLFPITATKNLDDVNTFWSKTDGEMLGSLTDVSAGIRSDFERMSIFKTLNKQDKIGALTLLDWGSREGVEITEAMARHGSHLVEATSKEAWRGYKGMRAQMDLVYDIHNTRIVDDLRNRGYSALHEIDGVTTYGRKMETPKQIEDALSDIKSAIDLSTGKTIYLGSNVAKSIRNRQGQLFKLRSEEWVDNKVYHYMYVPASRIKAVGVIPDRVVHKIEGYTLRHHEDSYFLEKVNPKVEVDGKAGSLEERSAVVGAADTKRDALERVKELTRGLSPDEIADGVTIVPRYSREVFKNMEAGDTSYEIMKRSGMLHKGQRGPLIYKGSEGGLDNTLSVFKSWQSSINRAVNDLQIAPIRKQLEKDFAEHYGALGILRRNNDGAFEFPTHKDMLQGGDKVNTRPMYLDALRTMEHIKIVGQMETPWASMYKDVMFTAGEMFDGTFKTSRGSAVTQALSKTGLNDILTRTAFYTYIAHNPIRQRLLQASYAYIYTPLDPKWVLSGAMHRETTVYMKALGFRHDKEVWLENLPKLAAKVDMTPEAFTVKVDSILETGLKQSLDSHAFIEASAISRMEDVTKGRALATKTINGVSYVPRKLNEVGFMHGEERNMISALLFAERRGIRRGAPISIKQAGREARQITGNMNTDGGVAWQKGVLRAATQFMQFPFKMLNVATFRNKGFTKEEVGMMYAWQAFMFGLSGFQADGFYEDISSSYKKVTGESINPQVAEIIQSGMGVFFINHSLNAAVEAVSAGYDVKPTRLDLSEFNPLKAMFAPAARVYDFTFSGDKAYEILGGPGFQAISGISESFVQSWDMLGGMLPEDSTIDVVNDVVTKMLKSTFGGVNKYHQGMIAYELGAFADKHGDPMVKATILEAIATATAGVPSYEKGLFYRAQNDLREQRRYEKQEARRIANTIENLFEAASERGGDAWNETVERISYNERWLKLMGEEHGRRMKRDIWKALKNRASDRNTRFSFYKEAVSRLASEMGEDAVRNRIMDLSRGTKDYEGVVKYLEWLYDQPDKNYTEEEE